MRFASYQRIAGKTRVERSIGNDEQVTLRNRVSAKRYIARCLSDGQADFGLQPLPLFVDETDRSDRCSANGGRKLGDVVVGRLGSCVEHTSPPQCRKTLLLVLSCWSVHPKLP